MKSSTPTILPILRSGAQGTLLAHLFLSDQEHTVAELARAAAISEVQALREVNRLEEAGLVVSTRRGRARLIRPDTTNPAVTPLTELLAVTFGPVPVLTRALASVPGIEEAFIYGSWAARHAGLPDKSPADIDVLVIGSADRDALYEIALAAEKTLGREVNIRRMTRESWRSESNAGFRDTVMSRPIVNLDLSEETWSC